MTRPRRKKIQNTDIIVLLEKLRDENRVEELATLLEPLGDTERMVLELRYGLPRTKPPPTLQELSAKYKVSIEEIRRLQREALKRVRRVSDKFPIAFEIPDQSVEVSKKVDRELVGFFRKHPAEMKTMNRRLFEELIAEVWHGFGYEVELTKQTRDGGKDIVAVRNAHVSERFLIECKRPDPGNPVSVQLVRALYGVKVSEGATKAILATTSHFSPDAQQFFENHKWELEGKDYEGVIGWLERYLAEC